MNLWMHMMILFIIYKTAVRLFWGVNNTLP